MSFCVECRRDIAPGTGLRCNACKVEYRSARNSRRLARKTKAAVVEAAAESVTMPDSDGQYKLLVYDAYRREYVRMEKSVLYGAWPGAFTEEPGVREGFCPQCRYQRPTHADCDGWCMFCFVSRLMMESTTELDFESIEAWCYERGYAITDFIPDGESKMTADKKEEIYGPVVATLESASSPGRQYEVRIYRNEAYSCNCAGWRFRRSCKHTDYCKQAQIGFVRDPVLEALRAAILESGVIGGITDVGLKRVAVNLKKRLGSLMVESAATEPLPDGRVIILDD